MSVRDVLQALRVGWWLPAVGLVVGSLVGLVYSLLATPLYTSQTQMFVSTTGSTSTFDVFQGGQFSLDRTSSYARLLSGEELGARVVDELRLEMSPGEVSSRVTAVVVPETVLLDVTVTDSDPERARDIAAGIGNEFPDLVSDLEATGPDGFSPVKVTVTQAPDLPDAPTSPDTAMNLSLGGLAGLLVGAAIAITRAQLDRSVKEPDQAAELAGAPVIGAILRDPMLLKGHVLDRHSTTRTAEDYRQLRTNLQFLNVDDPPRLIMVTSAVPSEGKTTVVVNLAMSLVDAGRRVTIVEADLRKPKVTRYLGMVAGVGLTNILAGSADLEEVIQPYGQDGLKIVASGPTPPNPGELLASSQMAALLDKLRGQSDYVLVDSPPLLPVADSSGLAALMDGVVLSVRYGTTRKEQLQEAAATLQRVGARTLGVILNIVPPKAEVATAYGYGYSYGYNETKHPSNSQSSPGGREQP